MVFIDKTTTHSSESKSKLESWKKGFQHEEKPLDNLYAEQNQTGDKLWGFLNQNIKDQLRADLNTEQEGICCYCCQSLAGKNTKIEHFLVKSAPDCEGEDKIQAFASRVFNYDNLLLSCDGGESSQNPYEIKRKQDGGIETKEDIASRLNVTTELLDKLNTPEMSYSLGAKIKYTEGLHCDAHRGNNFTPIVNPTTERNCWQYFEVKKDGSMLVNPRIQDDLRRQLIENTLVIVLNLDEPRLKDKRRKAFDAFSKAIDIDLSALGISLEDYLSLQLERVKTPFCFVNYLVILNRMGS